MSVTSRRLPGKKVRVSRRSNMYNGAGKPGFFKSLFSFAGFWVRVGLGISVVACISIVMLYAYRYVTVQSFFALKHVLVSGNSHRDDAQLIAESQMEIGQNIFEISIENIQQRLQGDPWIAEASVRRVLPDRLEIHVRENQACFWVKKGSGLYYSDRQGRIIDKIEPAKFISLPVLHIVQSGLDIGTLLDQTVRLMDGKMLPFGFASMTGITLHGDDVMEIVLDAPQMKVVLGIRDLEKNCRRLALVWDDLRQRGELNNTRVLQAFAGKAWATLRTT